MTRPRDGDPFSEQHRQYFHAEADVRSTLQEVGFTVTAVEEEYTHESADASTLRATWTARLRTRD
jgi:predicted TPR repeat methyltransferase